MSDNKESGISFFEKYLTLWVALCMVAGVLIGRFLPGIPDFLGKLDLWEGAKAAAELQKEHRKKKTLCND